MAYYASIYTVDSGELVISYTMESGSFSTITNTDGTAFVVINHDGASAWTKITYFGTGESDANQYGYVLNPYAGRGSNGSGEPISGATVTIGTAPVATTSANGFYNIQFSKDSFGFGNVSTPVIVTGPGVGSYNGVTTVTYDTSNQVDYYLLTVSGYGGSMCVASGRLMATARKKHSNDMPKGMKLKM